MKNKKLSVLFVLIAGCLWGTTGTFTRPLSALGIDGIKLTFMRSLISVFALFLIILFKDKKLFKINLKDIFVFIGSGILSFLFFSICYMYSIKLNSMSAASVLLYTAPVFIAIISVPLFKQKITLKTSCAIILTVLGCTFSALEGNFKMSKIGLLLGLLSGLGYALYSIFGRLAEQKGYSTLTITFYTFVFASLGGIFMTDIKATATSLFSAETLILTVVCAIVTTVLPYLFYTEGLSGLTPSTASVTASIEPISASVFGLLVFGEKISFLGILGIVLIVGAIFILNFNCKLGKNVL